MTVLRFFPVHLKMFPTWYASSTVLPLKMHSLGRAGTPVSSKDAAMNPDEFGLAAEVTVWLAQIRPSSSRPERRPSPMTAQGPRRADGLRVPAGEPAVLRKN